MKIAHLADLHIRGLSRHDEVRCVISDLCEKLIDESVDAIIVCGDTFHSKTLGITPEYIQLLSEILTKLSKVAPVHLMLGNHDGNVLNVSRQDAITPIVNALSNDNVIVYRDSAVVELAPGFSMCIYSIFDKANWDKVKPVEGTVSIATYHGPVIGSLTESEFRVDEGLDNKFFDAYDFVFLGDIHKMQYLAFRDIAGTSKPWMAYPGSLMQQNYAESLEHGFLVWDIRTRDDFDVKFVPLKNAKPYITIPWQGNVEATVALVEDASRGSRIRVKSDTTMSQVDTTLLVKTLMSRTAATEVTFKVDDVCCSDTLVHNDTKVDRVNLRNVEVLKELVQTHVRSHSEPLTDVEVQSLRSYVERCAQAATFDDVVNSKWSLLSLRFDNVFCYGENNVINFEKLSGIVGVFGPNRIGKSSIPGTIMYALHNGSDRGKIKNVHLVNARKQSCKTTALISVDGNKYTIERQTNKRETKKGVTVANTTLSFAKTGEDLNLNGEQRIDTEKSIRSLIGTEDDFVLTSLSAQGEHNNVILMGSSSRKLVLSKFLDLNIFDRLHEIARDDFSASKVQLKNVLTVDWDAQISDVQAQIDASNVELSESLCKIDVARGAIDKLKNELQQYDVPTVTVEHVTRQQKVVDELETGLAEKTQRLTTLQERAIEIINELSKLDALNAAVNVEKLREALVRFNELKLQIADAKHEQQREEKELQTCRKSLQLLDEVPCGDHFRNCKFIHDAFVNKGQIEHRERACSVTNDRVIELTALIEQISIGTINADIKKFEERAATIAKLERQRSENASMCVVLEHQITSVAQQLVIQQTALEALRSHTNIQTNEVVESIKNKISKLSRAIVGAENCRLGIASNIGRLNERLRQLELDKRTYEDVSVKNKIYELATNAFSKRGIPATIIAGQLPIINREIHQILAGIVDFTVAFELDDDNNDLEIYIDYGDSRRIIELGSGMEKMISSIAIRVALTNVSALPRSDMLIIDEGFGALDAGGVEVVNRLLVSLKSKYRLVCVITHVEGLKDVADQIIEVTKHEKDSFVCIE